MMNLKDDASHSQREHQETIRVSREHSELLAALICLKALHSPSTETLGKAQEWKGMIPGFDGPFCHQFKNGMRNSTCFFCKYQYEKGWKQTHFSPGFQKGWQWLLWSITRWKRYTLWLSISENKVAEIFSKRNHRGGVWVNYRAQKISQPQKCFWASKQETQWCYWKLQSIVLILKDVCNI